MKKGDTRSISRIRTFDGDVARAKGIEVPTGPKIQKEKVTAQKITDTLLKDTAPTAKDFIGTTDGEVINLPTAQKVTPVKKTKVHMSVPPPSLPTATSTPIKPAETKQSKKHHAPKKKTAAPNLEEEIQKISTPASKSVLTQEAVVYDASNNDLTEGTIITNKKRTKFKLFPAIGAAVQSWFTDTTTKITTPKKPQHTVNKAESRIATITAAARASNHAPQSDHGIVVKRLTKTKRKKTGTKVSITKKEDVAAPQWGSAVEEQPKVVHTPPTPPLTPPVLKEEKPVTIEQAQPEVVPPAPEAKTVPITVTEKVPTVTAKKSSQKEKRAEEKRRKNEQKELEKKKKKIQKKVTRKKRTYRATPEAISGVPVYIYIIVITGASLLGIGVSVYWFTSSTPSQEAVVIRVPSLFSSDAEVSVTLSTDRQTTLSTILDVSLTSRETIQIYPTVSDASGLRVPASAQEILNALALRAPGSFTRAVTDITFGSYNGTDSFILMKATNFDTAFGGLLEWEPDMSADLSPLFGIPVTQSFDPYARTDTQVRSAFFRDTIVANKSVRLLVDAQDNERLMYAFVTPNIILITPNADTFKAILPLVTQ